jgi:hypothetical protein
MNLAIAARTAEVERYVVPPESRCCANIRELHVNAGKAPHNWPDINGRNWPGSCLANGRNSEIRCSQKSISGQIPRTLR